MSAKRTLTLLPHGVRAAMASTTVHHKCGSSTYAAGGAGALGPQAHTNCSSLQLGRGTPGALCVCVGFFSKVN